MTVNELLATAGVPQFVYGHMKDYLRRVYGRAVVGRVYRKGKATPKRFRARASRGLTGGATRSP